MSGADSTLWSRWPIGLVLVASLALNVVALDWGLPNGNRTWAADALQPMTPLSVGRHVLFGERWNSGWFYFKYPVGHPLLVLGAQSPYLAWTWITGGMSRPTSKYPFGFKDPERSLAGLALRNRLISALMGTAVVALAFVTGALLFDASAGLVSAACVAGCYPFVFYAHTSNVDVPLLFWIAAAIAATLWSAQRDSRFATVLLGLSAAMALLTKEQSIGALVALPVVWCVHRYRHRSLVGRDLCVHAALAAAAFVVVTVVVANVPWNPSGYVNRWRFLMGTLPAEVREKYAPYQFMVQVPKEFSLARELQKLGKAGSVVAHGLTLPLALLSLAGLAWAMRRKFSAALVLLALAAAYYLLSVRALELVPVRYVMPLLYLALLAAGAAASRLRRVLRERSGHAWPGLAAAGLLLPLWPGLEVVRLLANDPRYQAEDWLRSEANRSARIEVYQPPTYLPRFTGEQVVTRVPVVQRTVEGFGHRRPDLVVLSGGGRAGLTGSYAKDWQPGKPLFTDSGAAQRFFEELQAGRLGYQPVARFRSTTWLIEPRINSLNPMITVYAPGQGS